MTEVNENIVGILIDLWIQRKECYFYIIGIEANQ